MPARPHTEPSEGACQAKDSPRASPMVHRHPQQEQEHDGAHARREEEKLKDARGVSAPGQVRARAEEGRAGEQNDELGKGEGGWTGMRGRDTVRRLGHPGPAGQSRWRPPTRNNRRCSHPRSVPHSGSIRFAVSISRPGGAAKWRKERNSSHGSGIIRPEVAGPVMGGGLLYPCPYSGSGVEHW